MIDLCARPLPIPGDDLCSSRGNGSDARSDSLWGDILIGGVLGVSLSWKRLIYSLSLFLLPYIFVFVFWDLNDAKLRKGNRPLWRPCQFFHIDRKI